MKLLNQQVENNGRTYTEESVKDMQRRIREQGVLFGELGHPGDSDIHLTNVSHTIDNIKLYDDGLYADFSILNTDGGRILKQGFEDNEPIGFSARSINGKLISIDAVIGNKIDYRGKKLERIIQRINDKRSNS